MSKFYCLAVNGLDEALFGNPLSALADYLNENTPDGVHFAVVGGADPRPFILEFINEAVAAHKRGEQLLLLGHSLGSMMMFYMADALKKLDIPVLLLVPIDATDWGTNAPGTVPYMPGLANAGKYEVPDNVDTCIYYRQPFAPGGGYAAKAPGNTHTVLETNDRVEPHVVLPVTPDIQQRILRAVLAVVKPAAD